MSSIQQNPLYETYENVVIGGGPTGLTIALYLSDLGEKVCLIDKNASLGGCHRVTRVENYFTEHGPRIYSSAYRNVHTVLEKIGTSFDDVFTPYLFNITSIQNQSLGVFTLREKLLIGNELLKFTLGLNKHQLKHTSVASFAIRHSFSLEAQDYMDRLCRLTDGAESERYNMLEFIQLINQNFFYKLYQPRVPNDKGLFEKWENVLIKNGVNIMKSTDVKTYEYDKTDENDSNNGIYTVILDNGRKIYCKNLFLCIPPTHFTKIAPEYILYTYSNENNIDIREWSEFNKYINDIPVSFHWNRTIELPKVWGFPKSDWGVAFIVLSDYMDADINIDSKRNTVITTCVTIQDKKSSVTGKTMHESNKEELISEVFRQLKISFPMLPDYDKAIIHPTVQYKDNKWIEDDQAYVETYKSQFVPAGSSVYENHYFVGTQNGRSYYRFTSMESAVTNSMYLLKKIRPEKLRKLSIKKPFELIILLRLLILIIIFISVIYTIKMVKK
jgi:hypothetical protein